MEARDDALEPIGLQTASLFIAARANAKVVQPIMGHASITMTFDR